MRKPQCKNRGTSLRGIRKSNPKNRGTFAKQNKKNVAILKPGFTVLYGPVKKSNVLLIKIGLFLYLQALSVTFFLISFLLLIINFSKDCKKLLLNIKVMLTEFYT